MRLTQQIGHVQTLADTGGLIPEHSSGYKIFPTPKQAARIDHFRAYLQATRPSQGPDVQSALPTPVSQSSPTIPR
jgi:hypothetical protein